MMRINDLPKANSIGALFACDPPIDIKDVAIHLIASTDYQQTGSWLAQQIADGKVQLWPEISAWLAQVDINKPAVLICDISDRVCEIHALIDKLQAKLSPVGLIVVGADQDATQAVALLKRGTIDYLARPFSDQQLQVAIAQAYGLTVDRAKLQHIRRLYEQLTDKEKRIAQELMQGNINKVIADNLDVSVRTVEVHRAHVMTKMQASHSSELIQKLLLVSLWKGYAPR